MAPVAFALFDAQTSESGRVDPLTLLEAVRRHADRIDIFHQAGQIALPDAYQPIVSYLEEAVHPTAAPDPDRIFHPKLWVLRFVTPDRSEASYRLLVMSRNLTFDHSWDTVVRLDGKPGPTEDDRNRPLREFVSALPDLAVVSPPGDRFPHLRSLADELLRVSWELPEHVDDYRFHPLIGSTELAVPTGDRCLMFSPFLSAPVLERIAEGAKRVSLVSRPEALDRMPLNTLGRFQEILHFDPASGLTEEESSFVSEELAEAAGRALSGLHAKVYVVDDGDRASLLTGSANATSPGFGGNVEFLVELKGRRDRLGTRNVLGEESPLRTMLLPYRRAEAEPASPDDTERAALDLERLGRRIASGKFTAFVEDSDDGFSLRLIGDASFSVADHMSLRCWPITLRPDAASIALANEGSIDIEFSGLSLTAITSFFCV